MTMITPLKKLYQHHAEDCLRVAELADDPRRRDLYLKLAREWAEAAETLGVDAAD
jgi:hypothetical protein